MHGEAKLLLKFLDGSDNSYITAILIRFISKIMTGGQNSVSSFLMTLCKSLRRTVKLTFLEELLLLRQVKAVSLIIL